MGVEDVAKSTYDEQVDPYHKMYVRFFPPATFYYSPDSLLVPALPSLPAPGSNDLPPLSFADLVHLSHFSLTSGIHELTIDDLTTVVNHKPRVSSNYSQRGRRTSQSSFYAKYSTTRTNTVSRY
jgi:hypothetical protein